MYVLKQPEVENLKLEIEAIEKRKPGITIEAPSTRQPLKPIESTEYRLTSFSKM